LFNVNKETKAHQNKIKEQDQFIKDTKISHEDLQIEFRKLKYEHTNLLKMSNTNKNTLQKERD